MYTKTASIEQGNNCTVAEEIGRQQAGALIYSALGYPSITIVEGGCCACQAGMKRAVVDLSSDISGGMLHMSKLIKGCAYNPKINCMAFCIEGMNIIIEPYKMTIHKAKDEVTAMRIVEWLKDIVKRH